MHLIKQVLEKDQPYIPRTNQKFINVFKMSDHDHSLYSAWMHGAGINGRSFNDLSNMK